MNRQDTTALSLIEGKINQLEKMKAKLLKKQSLSQIVKDKEWLWVIDTRDNKNMYYQVRFVSDCSITLIRYGTVSTVHFGDFNDNFRIASTKEFKQHIEFCIRTRREFTDNNPMVTAKIDGARCNMPVEKVHTIDPMKCDFYMVTCQGLMGAKVRHYEYAKAEKEAKRIAKMNNHETWIVGVVASVKPKEVVVTTTTIDTVVRKR